MRKVGLVFFVVIFLFSLSPFVFADDPHPSPNPPSSQNQQGNPSSQAGTTYLPYLFLDYLRNLANGGNGVTQAGHGARAEDNLERLFGNGHQSSNSPNAPAAQTAADDKRVDELEKFLSQHQKAVSDEAAQKATQNAIEDNKPQEENHLNPDGTCPPGAGGPVPITEKKK